VTSPVQASVVVAAAASLLAALTTTAQAQFPTWVDDVAPIVHTHCARCHHNGGPGPFPLLTYEDVFFTANMDVHVSELGNLACAAKLLAKK